jgi:hypothetical protein
VSNVKLEFHAGNIYAMAGGTPEHAALCLQVGSSLNYDRRRIEVFRREPNAWSCPEAGPGESVVLESISCRLDVDSLYDRAGA